MTVPPAPPAPKPVIPAPAPHPPDEPEITQEESVPLDRRDIEGEQAMDLLGRERRKAQED